MLTRLILSAGVSKALPRFTNPQLFTQAKRLINTTPAFGFQPLQQFSSSRLLTTPQLFSSTPSRFNSLFNNQITTTQSIFQQQSAQFHLKLKVNAHKRDRIGYKSRPHHASTKRFWQTGSGKIMRFRSGLNHKRRRKSSAQLRRLNKRVEVPDQSYRRLTKMMYLKSHQRLPQGQSRPVSKYWQPPKSAAKVHRKRYA